MSYQMIELTLYLASFEKWRKIYETDLYIKAEELTFAF